MPITTNLPTHHNPSLARNTSRRVSLPTTTPPLAIRVMEGIRNHHHHLPHSKRVGGFSCQPRTSHPPPIPSLVSSDDGQPQHSRPPPPSLSLKTNTPAAAHHHLDLLNIPLEHFTYLSRISQIPPPPLEHLTYLLNTSLTFLTPLEYCTSQTPHVPLHTSQIPPNTSSLPLEHCPPYVIIDIYVDIIDSLQSRPV